MCIIEVQKKGEKNPTWMGNIKTSMSAPSREATPNCSYRRTIAITIRKGADHKVWSDWHICCRKWTGRQSVNQQHLHLGIKFSPGKITNIKHNKLWTTTVLIPNSFFSSVFFCWPKFPSFTGLHPGPHEPTPQTHEEVNQTNLVSRLNTKLYTFVNKEPNPNPHCSW